MTTQRLTPGDTAPAFSAPDQNGATVSLSDFAGQKVILYFYPKAMTPGCTTEACDFRDNITSFSAEGFQVVGVSPDPSDKLLNFEEKEALTFPLLADENHSIAEAYGAWGEKTNYGKTSTGLIRSTFVIDENGAIIEAQYNVRAKGHVAKLRRDLGLEQK